MLAHPTDILAATHWEDADLILMARIKGTAGTNITQATISAANVYVFDALTELQVGVTLSLVVNSVVFDTLQTDARWTEDNTGYNFRTTISGTYFPQGKVSYRVEVIFTPSSGSNFPLVVEVSTQALWSS